MIRLYTLAAITALTLAACPRTDGASVQPSSAPTSLVPSSPPAATPTPRPSVSIDPRRGFPEAGPWLAYTGAPAGLDIAKAAATFRIIVIDADPDKGFTKGQIEQLRAGGKNKVLSFLKVGSVENTRAYWKTTIAPYVQAERDLIEKLGPVEGSPGEFWLNPANGSWQRLLTEYVTGRLVTQGVDGFVLDRLELVDRLPDDPDLSCSTPCRTGMLNLLAAFRRLYPAKLLVAVEPASDFVRLGSAGNERLGDQLDGVIRRNVYLPAVDDNARANLKAWQDMGLMPGGHPFWIGTLEQRASCATDASAAYAASRADGFNPYAAGASGACFE
jgi:cysteinyl-tRNA synthetase